MQLAKILQNIIVILIIYLMPEYYYNYSLRMVNFNSLMSTNTCLINYQVLPRGDNSAASGFKNKLTFNYSLPCNKKLKTKCKL